MKEKVLGYIICETDIIEAQDSRVVSAPSDRDKHVTIEARLQRANRRNRNGRFYDEKDLFSAVMVKRTKELIESGNFYGEAGHPLETDLMRQQTIEPKFRAHKMTKLWTEGEYVMCHTRGAHNDLGNGFDKEVREGMKPSFSLRALGMINETSRGTEVKNLKLITYDWVIYPSHEEAYMTKIITEAATGDSKNVVNAHKKICSETGMNNEFVVKNVREAAKISPITNPAIQDFIKTESANIGSILNTFDVLCESVNVIDNGRRVTMVGKNGDTFVISLENYIAKEIMDYCSRIG
jgi:hypothetical protein